MPSPPRFHDLLRASADLPRPCLRVLDPQAAEFVFRRCQELGVGLLVFTRFAAYAAPLHSFAFDELATIGHPVALGLRERQGSELNSLWRKATRPAGDPARESLPDHCDRRWFATTFCLGNKNLDAVADDRSIWPFISTIPQHDALALLAAHPTCCRLFFEVDVKQVLNVLHVVVGTSDVQPGVRTDSTVKIKSFVLNACHFALSNSLPAAGSLADGPPSRGPTTIFRAEAGRSTRPSQSSPSSDGKAEEGGAPEVRRRPSLTSRAQLRRRQSSHGASWGNLAVAREAVRRFRVGGSANPEE